MRLLKVLHVITRLDFGGAQQNTLYTVSHLDASRFEAVLVSGPGGALEGERQAVERSGARIVTLPSLVREVSPAKDVLALLELASLFASEKPDVVHTHSSKAGILGRLAAKAAGVPAVVHTYHGFGFHDYQNFWVKRLYVALERLCGRFTDRLVFVSRSNADYARLHGIGRPGSERLIRSGVVLSSFPAAVPDKAAQKALLNFGRHKPLVLSIGNLKPQKNPADFLAMAARVSAASPEAEFLFIGEGPLRDKLECQVLASNLSHRVALPGWRRDAAAWLTVADVFVMTSLWEGLPRALVEAMKSRLPCVCYRTDGVTDVIEDGVNGFLVAPGDVTALSKRVLELLADPALRARLGSAAAASIGAEFDIDAMVRAQERLYLELARA